MKGILIIFLFHKILMKLCWLNLGNERSSCFGLSNPSSHQKMENKLNQDSGILYLMNFLSIQWYGECRDIPSNVKDKLLHLGPATTKKEVLSFVNLCGFWRWHLFSVIVLLQCIHQVTQKSVSRKHKKARQQVQTCCSTTLTIRSSLHSLWHLRYQWQVRMVFGGFVRHP